MIVTCQHELLPKSHKPLACFRVLFARGEVIQHVVGVGQATHGQTCTRTTYGKGWLELVTENFMTSGEFS